MGNNYNRNGDFCDNISVQGFSHINTGKECQDFSVSWAARDYCCIIVSDGHGGDKYIRSATGSRIACEVGKELVQIFMRKFRPQTDEQIESSMEQLERAIVSAWYSRVEEDYVAKPLQEDARFSELEDNDRKALQNSPVKAYGATFLCAVKAAHYSYILQLGDGNCVLIFADNKQERPQELESEECEFNVTTSLCNSDAALSFHHCFRKHIAGLKVNGIILTSDGVINCYKSEEAYLKFISNVYEGYGADGVEESQRQLPSVLNQLSERGSGDDLSLAIIREEYHDRNPKSDNKKQSVGRVFALSRLKKDQQ